MMNFGEFCFLYKLSLNTAEKLLAAKKRYAKTLLAMARNSEQIANMNAAGKYYGLFDDCGEHVDSYTQNGSTEYDYWRDLRHDGWAWQEYWQECFAVCEDIPEDMNVDAYEPGYLSYENPMTGEWSNPYGHDMPDVLLYEDDEHCRLMACPGFNHGWDETALNELEDAAAKARETRLQKLHDWALKESAAEFYDLIKYTYGVLDEYEDRTAAKKLLAHGIWLGSDVGAALKLLAKRKHYVSMKGRLGNYLEINEDGFIVGRDDLAYKFTLGELDPVAKTNGFHLALSFHNALTNAVKDEFGM